MASKIGAVQNSTHDGALRWAMGSRSRLITVCALVVTTGSCSVPPSVATFPRCPVPVLLSRVNRIGHSTPVPTRPTGTTDHFHLYALSMESSESYTENLYVGTAESTETGEQYDIYATFQHSSSASSQNNPTDLTKAVARIVPNRTDAMASDIVIDELSLMTDVTFVGVSGGASSSEQARVELFGHKVWGQ